MRLKEGHCRCGWDGQGEHPCHSDGYQCRKPAKARFYCPHMRFSLAGAQLKFSVTETFACDECWEKFTVMMKEATEKAEKEYESRVAAEAAEAGGGETTRS